MSYNSELQSNNAELQQILAAVNALPEAGSVSSEAVLYIPQTLTNDQQAQARQNIGIEGTGKDGESITVVEVETSSEDGGENIVHFSDGSTLIVTNGNTGGRGLPGQAGADGANGAPGNGIKSAVLNADYTLTLTFDDGTSYTTPSIRGATGATGATGGTGPAGETGADGKDGDRGFGIFSTTDNMTLNPDGEFYEVLEGAIDVPYEYGGLMEGDFVFSTYTKNLYKIDHIVPPYCMLIKVADLTGETGAVGPAGEDGKDGKTPVKYVDYYTDADKAEFSEYIASELAKRGQLEPEYANSIDECTDTSKMYVLPDGFIYAYVMTVTEGGAGYTNLVPTSTDTDGSIYNGTGYKDNVRLSSSGGVSGTAQNGSVTTGFIPYSANDVVRIGGVEWLNATKNYGGHYYINFYDSSKKFKTYISSQAYADICAHVCPITRDENGVETFITNKEYGTSNEILNRVRESSYIRITAYGKGADLIVTVNEEIKEATSTVTYEWANTGRAFVPADYEDRIVEVENKASQNAARVGQLEGQMHDILDGETEIAAAAKFDPTVYGLPVLYLTGDISPIAVSKDNKVTVNYAYDGRSGTCTLKGQGATSYKKAKALVDAGKAGKFNYTINFDTAFEAHEGWGSQKKYCLKANWIDHSHSRNVVSAKLWGLIAKSRSNLPAAFSALPNAGAVDGFPIIIMLNDEFHGLYTWNIPKDGWMFGLVEDATKTQALLGANDHLAATQFKGESAGNDADFELEFVSDEDNATWVTPSLNRMINACRNSNGTDLDTTVAQYLDWDSVIDYYIWIVVCKGEDMVDKNYLLVTLDGVKWHFSAYDMDSTYGLAWDGSGLSRAVSNINFVECASTHRAYELIKNHKKAALKARYNTLRANVLSETRICQYFENFAWAIPSPVLMEDVKKYPTIMGSSVNGIDQICRWVRQRLEVTDKWIEEL